MIDLKAEYFYLRSSESEADLCFEKINSIC